MTPPRRPAPPHQERPGDPVTLLMGGSRPGRIHVELVEASPLQRARLTPVLRFLHRLPKPPAPEVVTLAIGTPEFLARAVEGKLRGLSLEIMDRLAGLQILLPYDRRQAQGSLVEWVALLRDRLRERLTCGPRGPRPRPETTHS